MNIPHKSNSKTHPLLHPSFFHSLNPSSRFSAPIINNKLCCVEIERWNFWKSISTNSGRLIVLIRIIMNLIFLLIVASKKLLEKCINKSMFRSSSCYLRDITGKWKETKASFFSLPIHKNNFVCVLHVCFLIPIQICTKIVKVFISLKRVK